MLDSLYQSLFRPRSGVSPLAFSGVWALFFLLSALTAFDWAGRLDVGFGGLIGLWIGAFILFALGWFWLGASTGMLAQLLGGKGSGPLTMQAIAAAFWPALLNAPLLALSNRWPKLAGLLGFLVFVWVLVGLVRAIAQVHELDWGRATLCLVGSSAAVLLGLSALVAAPAALVAIAFA